jgi:hypothetical protein
MPRCATAGVAYTLTALQALQLSGVQIGCLDAQHDSSVPIESPLGLHTPSAVCLTGLTPAHILRRSWARPRPNSALGCNVTWMRCHDPKPVRVLCTLRRLVHLRARCDSAVRTSGCERIAFARDRTRHCSSRRRRCGRGRFPSSSSCPVRRFACCVGLSATFADRSLRTPPVGAWDQWQTGLGSPLPHLH